MSANSIALTVKFTPRGDTLEGRKSLSGVCSCAESAVHAAKTIQIAPISGMRETPGFVSTFTELQYHGVDPAVDTDIDFHSVSVSALPLIAQAAGLNPNSVLSRSELVGTVPGTVNPRVTDRDREIVAAVEKAYVPSPQRVMESVVNDPSRQEVLHAAAYGMFAAKDRVKELRENNAEHRELKRACVREIELERKFAESMNMYLDDIQFAVRDAEFVPHADMDSIQFPEGVSASQRHSS